MDEGTYIDPFAAAYGDGARRVAELASVAATAAQLWASHRRDQQAARAIADEKAAREAREARQLAITEARTKWAPAYDSEWLGKADLLTTARVWGAAAPFGNDPEGAARHAEEVAEWEVSKRGTAAAAQARDVLAQAEEGKKLAAEAAKAMGLCEKRLRVLHPHAMKHYDRLRELGQLPIQAMGNAAVFFDRDPRIHDAQAAPERARLEAGQAGAQPWAADFGPTPGELTKEQMEARAGTIVKDLQSRAANAGLGALGEAELRTRLEVATNLPEEVIDKVVREDAHQAADGRARGGRDC